jgi:hypothetical protein
MIQTGAELRFLFQDGLQIGIPAMPVEHNLQRDASIKPQVLRQEDAPHRPIAELALQKITAGNGPSDGELFVQLRLVVVVPGGRDGTIGRGDTKPERRRADVNLRRHATDHLE